MADDIEATLKTSEINRDRVEDATKFLEVGQEVEAKIINVDRKSRSINLSIKAKDEAEESCKQCSSSCCYYKLLTAMVLRLLVT